jgi:aldehyde dehydrogenase (NAD+)
LEEKKCADEDRKDYAGWADKIKGDSFTPEDGFYKIVTQEPLGVCAGITAWNGSLHFLAWKAAPALACGNTSIIKPSEKSPLGTLAVGYLIEAAGFPPGAFQILPGEFTAHL